jgi:hypothetical protein
VQQYADEKKRIWEDIRHGVIYGSKVFVAKIKKDYLNGERDADVPARKKIVYDYEKFKSISKV